MSARARPIPLEDFFRKPERAAPSLSPAGGYLAWLAPWERRLNLFVRELATGEERRVSASKERDLMGFCWPEEGRLLYTGDRGGDENWRLYAVSWDGSAPVELTPFEGVQAFLVDPLEEVEGQVLVRMNRRVPEVFDAWRLDVHGGELELLAENPGNVQQWITDHQGRLRLATTTDGVDTSILYREREEDPWRTVATYSFREGATPLFFTFDDRALYVSSNVGRDKRAIFEYDLATGREGELIFEHPEVDVAGLLASKRRKRVTGVAYETDRPRYHFLDERRAAIQRFLSERLPGRENDLVSHTRDETRYVVHSWSERSHGTYWLLDAPEEGEPRLESLFEAAPWLREEELAEVRPIRYTAGDGLEIHGYLTLPPGREPRALPLVVRPHGGPWTRDHFGFDAEAQFLASRGAAVLQMDFRGSVGYGREFWERGFRQWGLAMQDDVTDGVRWAIAEGYADPARVAIYGGSYGGYAALMGLVKTPELYACGVSYVGVSSLFTWLEAVPPYWKPLLAMVHEMVGHPERDEAQWRATSPLFHVDRIRAPLFVAQGANDPRVRRAESDQMVAALRARGVPVEYLVKEDEGHGFLNEENQFDFYRSLEAFLARHLGLEQG